MNTLHLSEWVNRLSKEEIPTFAQTARRMAALSSDKESSANDLAKVILQDPTMTTRVLRLVNSAFYNPSGRELDTVSYAIVVLGFEKVRNLALTVSMLESSINNALIGPVKNEMACAYHAAIQAKKLAEKAGIADTENIYIAALLHRLGQLMFWCFPYEFGDQLSKLSEDPEAYEKVENELLGFSLRELTDSLITEWNLSPLLHDALNNKSYRDKKNACILHGFNIANATRQSWESANSTREIRAISAFINCSMQDTKTWLIDNARTARTGLKEIGLDTKDCCIAVPHVKAQEKKQTSHKVIGIFDKKAVQHESRYDRQNRLLRQLTHLLSEELDLNHFLLTMLEGIHTAIECDQSFILLTKGKEQNFVLKQHLGNQSTSLANSAIDLLQNQHSSLYESLSSYEPRWSETDVLLQAVNQSQFVNRNIMVMPIKAMAKNLGFIFAIKTDKNDLTEHDFESFQHFCEHACLAFRLFINQKK